MTVKKYWQSGQYAEKILIKSLSCLNPEKKEFSNILILGLGGGSFAKIISHLFPQAKIIGVELDPEMIALGIKYLGLSDLNNLSIVIDRAEKFVQRKEFNNYFDLILTDIFIGCDVPHQVESNIFVKNIYCLLKSKGVFITNRSYLPRYQFITDEYCSKVKKVFKKVNSLSYRQNLIVEAFK